ncbi:MAG: DNA-binding protein, partial [Pontibacterium sp.]
LTKAAEKLIQAGSIPSISELAVELNVDESFIESPYREWLNLLLSRGHDTHRSVDVSIQEVPPSINAAFSRIWHEALNEASSRYSIEQHQADVGAQEALRHADEELQRLRQKYDELEHTRYEWDEQKNELKATIKSLEAEVEALKASIVSETGQRKAAEHGTQNLEHELTHLRRQYDESRRTFERRLKEEHRNALDLVSKSEADVRYYRSSLEKVRDEAGKKESALTKSIHDLQAELAKRDVKLETQKNHIKAMEAGLKSVTQEHSGLTRDMSRLNSSSLSEANKNKRLEEQVSTLEEELRVAKQRKVAAANETSRREAALRAQLSERNEELMRTRARNTSLEKRVLTLEEEVRRSKTIKMN